MSAMKKLAKFSLGGVLGAAAGALAGLLLAPESGRDLQRNVRERFKDAKVAGIEARAETEQALIARYRAGVNDPTALREAETESRQSRTEQIVAAGLSLNAPGAIAAQDTADRAKENGESVRLER